MVIPMKFILFYFIFFGLRKYVYIFYQYRGGGLWSDIQYNKGPDPPLMAWDQCTYKSYRFILTFREASAKYPISWEIHFKHPFSVFLGEIFPRQTAEIYSLS